jgi:hypothetical protein
LGVISRHFPAHFGAFWQILALFGQMTCRVFFECFQGNAMGGINLQFAVFTAGFVFKGLGG